MMIGCLDPYENLESCRRPPTRSTFEESMNGCRDKRGLDELRGHLLFSACISFWKCECWIIRIQ